MPIKCILYKDNLELLKKKKKKKKDPDKNLNLNLESFVSLLLHSHPKAAKNCKFQQHLRKEYRRDSSQQLAVKGEALDICKLSQLSLERGREEAAQRNVNNAGKGWMLSRQEASREASF
jgi:hypothetical protein